MKRAVIYSQNHDDTHLEPWVWPILASLSTQMDEVHLMASDRLDPEDLPTLPGNGLLHRCPVEEHQFLRWSRALKNMNLDEYHEIFMMHDDLVCSPESLKLFLSSKNPGWDVWALTACRKPEWHLQTDLLAFNRSAIQSKAFRDFFSHLLPLRDPGQVHRSYGMGLSILFQEAGFRLGARYSGPRLGFRLAGDGLHGLWRLARVDDPLMAFGSHLMKLGCPFFHAEALRSNPRWDDLRQLRFLALKRGVPSHWLQQGSPSPGLDPCRRCGNPAVAIRHAGIPGAVPPPRQNLWNMLRCLRCHHHWMAPRPTESQLAEAYADYYTHGGSPTDRSSPASKGWRGLIVNLLERFNRRVLRIYNAREALYRLHLPSGSGRLLEVGCGSGERLAHLRSMGWEVLGQEVDSKAATVARERHGLEILVGELAEQQVSDASFDVIVLNHVLEHLPDPGATLREIHRLLRPGGRLLLATPNPLSLGHRCFQRFWHFLSIPHHLELFSRRSLKTILGESGFRKVRVRTTPANAEIIALHGRDLLADGTTDLRSTLPRLGKEPIPMAFQALAVLCWFVARGTGEELLAEAYR